MAEKIAEAVTMGNLLGHALELGSEAGAMQLVLMLIRAGAMMRNDGKRGVTACLTG